MKSYRSILLFLAILLVPGLAAAEFSIFGAYMEPEDYDAGYGIGARFAFGGKVQFEATGTYFTSFDQDILGIDIDSELDVIPVDLGVRFNPGKGTFYVAGGATYYFLDHGVFGNLDDEYGFYVTLGGQFQNGLFIEVTYRDVDGTVQTSGIGDTEFGDMVPVDLSGFGANIGFRFGGGKS